MKTTIRKYIFVLLTAGGMVLSAGNAAAEISGLGSYPLVCQKGLAILDHDINSFNKLFGQPISKNSHKLTDTGFEGIVMTEITYRNEVVLTYLSGKGKDLIFGIKLGSSKARKLAGFDVQTKSSIKKLYGVPDRQTSNSLIYECEGQALTFTIKNGQIIVVNIRIESSVI